MKEVGAFYETRRGLRIKDSELLGEVLVSEYNLCKKGVKITRYDQRISDHREDRSKSSCSLPPLWSWRIFVIRPPDTRPPGPGRRRTGTEVVTCSRFLDPMVFTRVCEPWGPMSMVLTLTSTSWRNVGSISTITAQIINLHAPIYLAPVYLTFPIPGEEIGHLQPTLPQGPGGGYR